MWRWLKNLFKRKKKLTPAKVPKAVRLTDYVRHIDRTKDPVVLLGIRGYYAEDRNKRGVYDDALVWITPEGTYTFKGNTDPSRYRKGEGYGSKKGMACLTPGTWRYKTGTHYGSFKHKAFRQADKVTVMRDGITSDYSHSGKFGINIHRGGYFGRSTSSLGCQTIPRKKWKEFKELGYRELEKHGTSTNFPYVLVEA